MRSNTNWSSESWWLRCSPHLAGLQIRPRGESKTKKRRNSGFGTRPAWTSLFHGHINFWYVEVFFSSPQSARYTIFFEILFSQKKKRRIDEKTEIKMIKKSFLFDSRHFRTTFYDFCPVCFWVLKECHWINVLIKILY